MQAGTTGSTAEESHKTDRQHHTSIQHRLPWLPLSSGDPINITKEREVVR